MNGSKGLYMAETKPISLKRAFWLYGVGYLSIFYLVSLLALCTPIDWSRPPQPMEGGPLYLRIALFVAVCGYGGYRAIRLILKAGRASQGSKLWVITAVAAVTFAIITQLVLMPLIFIEVFVPNWRM